MPGTKEGGRKTAQTIYQRYGKSYYQRIGTVGGKKGRTGGFYANRDLARWAGSKGGRARVSKGRFSVKQPPIEESKQAKWKSFLDVLKRS